jgi:hypothetical protein
MADSMRDPAGKLPRSSPCSLRQNIDFRKRRDADKDQMHELLRA